MLVKAIVHVSQIAILNIYVAPHSTLINIMNTIAKTLHYLNLNEIIIILGDFNIDMLQSNENTIKLENYMCSYSVQFLLQKVNHEQKTLIDHVWSNVPNVQSNIFLLDAYWTEHDTICLLLEI
jgi:hypothetical protein